MVDVLHRVAQGFDNSQQLVLQRIECARLDRQLGPTPRPVDLAGLGIGKEIEGYVALAAQHVTCTQLGPETFANHLLEDIPRCLRRYLVAALVSRALGKAVRVEADLDQHREISLFFFEIQVDTRDLPRHQATKIDGGADSQTAQGFAEGENIFFNPCFGYPVGCRLVGMQHEGGVCLGFLHRLFVAAIRRREGNTS